MIGHRLERGLGSTVTCHFFPNLPREGIVVHGSEYNHRFTRHGDAKRLSLCRIFFGLVRDRRWRAFCTSVPVKIPA